MKKFYAILISIHIEQIITVEKKLSSYFAECELGLLSNRKREEKIVQTSTSGSY